jgi:Zn-dependent M28 family amino/carboxypeptidase
MPTRAAVWVAVLIAASACTSAERRTARETLTPSPSTNPPPFDATNVAEVVDYLAGEIGPRETTSAAYRKAAAFVESRFRSFGYAVRRQTFRVPAGLSNRAAVQEGETFNVIAEQRGFDPTKRHVVVGAHLDTVPQAPGAVDNAAGVGIVLELARLASLERPRIPVVFVAFGGEEARVPNGGLHGSRAFVAALDTRQRRAIAGAIVIDRLGTGERVPVCTASTSSVTFARSLLDAARRARVPAFSCTNGTSDHVPFDGAGISAVRLGPDNFRQYHTPQDVPSIFVPAQALRAGRLLCAAVSAAS